MLYYENIISGAVGSFGVPQDPNYWLLLTPPNEKIDAFLLTGAQTAKVAEVKIALSSFRFSGFVYNTWKFNLSEASALYVKSKNDDKLGGDNKYYFYDMSYIKRYFTDAPGFGNFSKAIQEEEERIMEKYNSYRYQINVATTIAEVDAITISFNP